MFRAPLQEITGRTQRLQFTAVEVAVVALAPRTASGHRPGLPGLSANGRAAVDQGQSLGYVVDVGRGGDVLGRAASAERGTFAVVDQTVPTAHRETSGGHHQAGTCSELREVEDTSPPEVRRTALSIVG